jgi:hypothetical protein
VGDLNGHALIIRPLSHETGIPTSFGEKDAIKCDVADLTAGTYHPDCLWFPGGIIGSLKGRIGQLVLAQVAQGEPKPGQSPPWILLPLAENPDVVAAANAWLAANPGKLDTAFAAPTPAAPVAAPAAPALAPTAPLI